MSLECYARADVPGRSRAVALALSLCSLAAVGCGRRQATPEPAPVGPYRVGDVNVHMDADTDMVIRAGFETAVRASLLATPVFAEVGPEALPVEAWGAVAESPRGDPAVEVLLHVRAPKAVVDAFPQGVVEAHVAWPLHGAETPEEGFTVALDRASAAVLGRLRLAAGEPGAVATLLRDGDPQLAVIALEFIRRNRDVTHIELVASLVRHADQTVASLAVEVVGELGGPRHAPALIQNVRLADPGHTHRTYDALATLGGPDAEGFLRFAARNEDDPERRAAARLALDKLMRSTGPARPRPNSLRGHRQ